MTYNTTVLPDNLKTLSLDEQEYLCRLVQAGTPVCAMAPGNKRYSKQEFNFTTSKDMRPSLSRVDNWRPGYALLAKTGYAFDAVDVDPRNGGGETFELIKHLLPEPIGIVRTPRGGHHYLVPALNVLSIHFGGIDYQANEAKLYLPGTIRGTGSYTIEKMPVFDLLAQQDASFYDALVALGQKVSADKRLSPSKPVSRSRVTNFSQTLSWATETLAAAPPQARWHTANRVSFTLGIQAGDDFDVHTSIEQALLEACMRNNWIKDDGISTVINTIRCGLRDGIDTSNLKQKGQ
jgi:hypothetical protein